MRAYTELTQKDDRCFAIESYKNLLLTATTKGEVKIWDRIDKIVEIGNLGKKVESYRVI